MSKHLVRRDVLPTKTMHNHVVHVIGWKRVFRKGSCVRKKCDMAKGLNILTSVFCGASKSPFCSFLEQVLVF